MPTITHADWSNRPRTAFQRWTQAVHQVAAIHVGRHHFLACPYRFQAGRRQANAGLASGHSHCRTAFESFAPDILEQSYRPLRHTQPWQPTFLSKLPTYTARGCHMLARTHNARQRDKSPDSPATPSRTGKHTHSIARMATSQLKVGTLLNKQHVYVSSEMRFRAAGRGICLLYTSPSPRDLSTSRMPSSA